MKALSLDRASHRIAIAAAVALLLVLPLTATRIAGTLLAVGLLPGLAIAPRRSIDAGLGIGIALSPVVFGCLVWAALLAGLGVDGAARSAVAVALALFAASGGLPAVRDGDRRPARLVGAVIVTAAVMALALPLADAWWRTRDDSWFHAAAAEKLARDGLPLTDPYFAGLRLQYAYFYHGLLSGCSSLAGVDAFYAMILMNGIALVSAALTFHQLSGLFSRRTGPRVLGLCVWLFAMNGWFYLFYPLRLARAAFGQTAGVETLRSFFPWTPSGHTTAMSLISVEGNQFMFLDKFMIGTAFSLTLGLMGSLLYLLLRARCGEWSRRHDAAWVLCVAGSMLLHPVTGATVAVVTAAVLAVLIVVRARPSRGGPAYARLLAWVAVGAAGTIPYLRSILPHAIDGDDAVALRFQPAHALGILADVAPALILALLFLRRAEEHRDTDILGSKPFAELSLSATGMLAMWTVLVAVAALTIDLTANNETKFAYLVWLPLAVFSVGALERWWSNARLRRAGFVLVVSATLPLAMLYYHHAVRDRSTLIVSDAEHEAYAWIRSATPDDAVFVEENELARIPVLAARDLLWGTEAYARNWRYPADEMAARRSLRDAVFSHPTLSDRDLDPLRRLGRRAYVVYRKHGEDQADPSVRFTGPPGPFRPVFANPELAVWELVWK